MIGRYTFHQRSSFVPIQTIPLPYERRTCSIRQVTICSLSESTLSVQARTIGWARMVVCGLNLCPFAQQVLDNKSLRLQVSPVSTELQVKQMVLSEIDYLLQTSPSETSTTLLVFPEFAMDNFLQFHSCCNELEWMIEKDEQLIDQVMLATFHPLHQWEETDIDDAINFDKRAPYPIINLLRAKQVDEYVRQGKTQMILERNRKTLEKIGGDKLRGMYASLLNTEQES